MSAPVTFLIVVVAAFLSMFGLSEWHDRMMEQSARLPPVMPAIQVDPSPARTAFEAVPTASEVRDQRLATMAVTATAEDSSTVVPDPIDPPAFESAAARHQEELRRPHAR